MGCSKNQKRSFQVVICDLENANRDFRTGYRTGSDFRHQ